MPECKFCGKDSVFIFKCRYCNGVFCTEHRIAESHQCSNIPHERIPLSAPEYREPSISSLGRCPNCRTYAISESFFDAETMTFECRGCGRIWTQLKREPHEIVETRMRIETEKNKAKKKKRRWFFS